MDASNFKNLPSLAMLLPHEPQVLALGLAVVWWSRIASEAYDRQGERYLESKVYAIVGAFQNKTLQLTDSIWTILKLSVSRLGACGGRCSSCRLSRGRLRV